MYSDNKDLETANNDLDDDNNYLDNDFQDWPVLRETEEGAIVQLCPGPVLHPAGAGVHTGLLLWRQHLQIYLVETEQPILPLLVGLENVFLWHRLY